ncbi:hypothetical protein SISSUDRAFT_1045414 [Sistotremastrum suecicum HHB10207 ss-3]|uniref:DUF6534 domain-containing protein n=1 Tax=Sistotremastrum suecicum HHB10207 ss-3 TaxID=1314776 RepID=A0A166EFR7_9AGAM|nr:hypothetical protein SISSUDRAFT_1045414 [Sistotremastrum suecicum HHB10207 ss-3]
MAMPIPAALVPSFGYVLIGVLVTSLLHGFTTFQTIAYFRMFPKDSWVLKWMVLVVMMVEFLHLALCWHFEFFYFRAAITSNQEQLLSALWSILVTIPLTMLVVSISHIFSLTKLWKISNRNWILCAIIATLETTSVGTQLALSVKLFGIPLWPEIAVQLRTLVSIAFALVVCTDVSIAASLCYYLRKRRTGYQQTDSMIAHLVYYTVNNGILTSALDMVMMGLFLGVQNSLSFLAVLEVISKVYVATILTSLSTRNTLRTRMATGDIQVFRDQRSPRSAPGSWPVSPPSKPEGSFEQGSMTSSRSHEERKSRLEAGGAAPPITVIKIDRIIETHTDGMDAFEGKSIENV